jgi:hypothetical protein
VLPTGAELQVLEQVGDWLRVDAGGDRGFVSAAWIQRVGTGRPLQPTPPPAPTPPTGALQIPPGASAIDRQVANTWNRFGGLLIDHAQRLGIDPAVATGVFITTCNDVIAVLAFFLITSRLYLAGI